MATIDKAIDIGIEKIIGDFQQHPHYYFTEEDVRWRLLREIEGAMAADRTQIHFSGGVTSAIHTEYPTPFRCSMKDRQFKLLDPDSKGQRGHFDIVILNAATVAGCSFEVLRSQYYRAFLEKLRSGEVLLPFLDIAIEIKLFRDLAHSNRAESARQQAEYAVQAINKIAATLEAQPGYYPKPFAKRGLVLLFDNSDLVCSGDAEVARGKFQERFRELTDWDSLPDTLCCIWVTPQRRKNYQGLKSSAC